MKIEPYIIFNGNCREAITFYEKVFNGKITFLMEYKDAPNPPQGFDNLIMHANLLIDDTMIMFSDTTPDIKTTFGDAVTITVALKDQERIKQIYDVLKNGGKVRIALGKTFYSDLYAMVEDKFGIVWQLIIGG